jgi:hypothetical protein
MKYICNGLEYKYHCILDVPIKNLFYFLFVRKILTCVLQKSTLQKYTFQSILLHLKNPLNFYLNYNEFLKNECIIVKNYLIFELK